MRCSVAALSVASALAPWAGGCTLFRSGAIDLAGQVEFEGTSGASDADALDTAGTGSTVAATAEIYDEDTGSASEHTGLHPDSGDTASTPLPSGADCAELFAQGWKENGRYSIHPDETTGDVFDVYCDMSPADGPWTIVYAGTGADGEEPMTSNTARDGNPFEFEHYNLTREQKVAISRGSAESIFVGSDGQWIHVDAAMFDTDLVETSHHAHTAVRYHVSNSSADGSGLMGWNNDDTDGGSDFYLSEGDCNGNWHSSNCSCEHQYLYSPSPDTGYAVGLRLGTWGATGSGTCDPAEGAPLVFYAAMR